MTFRIRSLASVALLGALAIASTANSTSPTAVNCRSGYGAGVFELPQSNTQPGDIDGVLSLGVTGVVAYYINGDLVAQPTPCLSCIYGKIEATLDDGIGAGPDYIVRGQYIGNWMSGAGQVSASIFALNGSQRVGKISGTFDDPPASTQPGHFDVQWRVCD